MALPEYLIADLPLRNGWLGIGPMPGRSGFYQSDLTTLLRWGPSLVLSMTPMAELERSDAGEFGSDLRDAEVAWRHLPIEDFGAPAPDTERLWPEASAAAHAALAGGGKVFAHCYGGCGRSGMALMRLMVEAGEDADPARARLRDVRPCAVETEAQAAWAALPMYDRLQS